MAPSSITEMPKNRKMTVKRRIVWSLSALETATSTYPVSVVPSDRFCSAAGMTCARHSWSCALS